jgi:hypothetical protein
LTVAVWSEACSIEVLRQLTAEPQNNIMDVATHAQTDKYWKAKDCRHVAQTRNIHKKRRKFVSTKEGLSRDTNLLDKKLAANLDRNCWWPQCEIAAQNAVTYFGVASGNLRRQWRTIYLTPSIILFGIYKFFV